MAVGASENIRRGQDSGFKDLLGTFPALWQSKSFLRPLHTPVISKPIHLGNFRGAMPEGLLAITLNAILTTAYM